MIMYPWDSKTEKSLTINARTDIELTATSDVAEMLLQFKFAVTAGAAAAPAIDGLQKLIKSISVKDDQGRTLVSIIDSRTIVQYNCLQIPNAVKCDVLPTAPGVYDLQVDMILHASRNGAEAFDIKSIFNGADVKLLMLEITLGTATDLGTGYTLGAISVEPTLASIQYSSQVVDRSRLFADRTHNKPSVANIVTEKRVFAGTTANLGEEIVVPVSRIYHKSMLMVLNAAGERSDSVVSRIAIGFPGSMNKKAWNVSWNAHKGILRRNYPNRSGSDLVGIAMIDWSEVTGLLNADGQDRTLDGGRGFDTGDMDKGDVVIQLTTEAPGTIITLQHFSVAPGE